MKAVFPTNSARSFDRNPPSFDPVAHAAAAQRASNEKSFDAARDAWHRRRSEFVNACIALTREVSDIVSVLVTWASEHGDTIDTETSPLTLARFGRSYEVTLTTSAGTEHQVPLPRGRFTSLDPTESRPVSMVMDAWGDRVDMIRQHIGHHNEDLQPRASEVDTPAAGAEEERSAALDKEVSRLAAALRERIGPDAVVSRVLLAHLPLRDKLMCDLRLEGGGTHQAKPNCAAIPAMTWIVTETPEDAPELAARLAAAVNDLA